MLRIAVIDDEVNIRKGIIKILKLLSSDYEVVGEAASINEAKTMLQATDPDVVLLDIELEDGSGFELLNQLPSINFKLIFITAFNQYAIKAFKFNAIDYLLKPIDPIELKTVLTKVQSAIHDEVEVRKLLENLAQHKNTNVPKIVIKTTKKTHFITVADILYCEAKGAYTKIITQHVDVLASKNLKYFQELLADYSFIRTHQSYLVNKIHIIGLNKEVVLLNDNLSIPISLRRKAEIKALLLNK